MKLSIKYYRISSNIFFHMEVCIFKVSRESNLFESTSYLIRKPSGNKCNILRIILCFHLVKFFFDFVLAGLFNSKEFLFKSFNDLKKRDNANCSLQWHMAFILVFVIDLFSGSCDQLIESSVTCAEPYSDTHFIAAATFLKCPFPPLAGWMASFGFGFLMHNPAFIVWQGIGMSEVGGIEGCWITWQNLTHYITLLGIPYPSLLEYPSLLFFPSDCSTHAVSLRPVLHVLNPSLPRSPACSGHHWVCFFLRPQCTCFLTLNLLYCDYQFPFFLAHWFVNFSGPVFFGVVP